MLNVWLMERSDKETMQRVCLRLSERLRSNLEVPDIQWRVVSEQSIWPECVRLVKSEPHSVASYPDIIEYPAHIEPSLWYLKLLGECGGLSHDELQRWRILKDKAAMDAVPVSSGGALSLEWLKGALVLYYRKDALRLMQRGAEVMEDYHSWLSCLDAANSHFPHGSLEMQPDFQTALWWIRVFGGDFLDPLNLAAAFANAEAVQGLEAMLKAMTGFSRRLGPESVWGGLQGIAPRRRRFPENAFSCLCGTIPRAVLENDPRTGCVFPPSRDGKKTAVVNKYHLALTSRGASEKGARALAFLEAVLEDEEGWLETAYAWGLSPSSHKLQERFWESVESQETRTAYESAIEREASLPETPLVAPLIEIFRDTLEAVLLSALREGGPDRMHLAAAFSKAASEYRLISALYGPLEAVKAAREADVSTAGEAR